MSEKDSLAHIEGLIAKFSRDRDWDQFHTPKNLIMAATSEIGELAELLQWKSDEEAQEFLSTPMGRERISQEIADVAIYLIRLCQRLGLNFIDVLNMKMSENEMKYPVDKSKGSSKKYTDL